MLSRRGFIFAAPAIVAASTLMPVSARFIRQLIMPKRRTFIVEGYGAMGEPLIEEIPVVGDGSPLLTLSRFRVVSRIEIRMDGWS
jgi:hypothetical protein